MAWILPHSFVVFCSMTTSHIFSNSPFGCKGTRGRECGLILRELTALTGKIAVSICAINIVNRLQCFLDLGVQKAGLVGRLCDILGGTTDEKTEGPEF